MKAYILTISVVFAACVVGDPYHGIIAKTEQPGTFILLTGSEAATEGAARVLEISLYRVNSGAEGRELVWQIKPRRSVPSQKFRFLLFEVPAGFEQTQYKPSVISEDGDYRLYVRTDETRNVRYNKGLEASQNHYRVVPSALVVRMRK